MTVKMAKLIAALGAAAVMIVIILVMVNFFLRMIGGGLISSLSDATLPLETQPMTEDAALPWDAANDEALRSDAAFDNAGEIASDSQDDNALVDTDEDDNGEGEEVPLMDPDEVSPGDYAEGEDMDQTQWNEELEEAEGRDQAAAARFAQVLAEPKLLSNLPDDVIRRLYQPLTVLDIDETQAFDLWQYPDAPGISQGQVYGALVGVTVLQKGEATSLVSAVDYLTDRRVQGYVPNELLRTVHPDKRYSIVIDKAVQKLYLFAGARLSQTLTCSTGAADESSAGGSTETPSGEYITGGVKQTIYSEVSSDVAYYAVRFNGRVYVHGIPHVNGDYSEGQADLGKKASHGCVRIPEEEAQWLYENLPAGTRVLVMGDEHTLAQRGESSMENG